MTEGADCKPICAACGYANAPGAALCGNCGALIADVAAAMGRAAQTPATGVDAGTTGRTAQSQSQSSALGVQSGNDANVAAALFACALCGFGNPPDAAFCGGCGSAFAAADGGHAGTGMAAACGGQARDIDAAGGGQAGDADAAASVSYAGDIDAAAGGGYAGGADAAAGGGQASGANIATAARLDAANSGLSPGDAMLAHRRRLRLTLLASTAAALLLAAIGYGVGGPLWAAAPLIVAAGAFALSLGGRVNRASLALFWEDAAAIARGVGGGDGAHSGEVAAARAQGQRARQDANADSVLTTQPLSAQQAAGQRISEIDDPAAGIGQTAQPQSPTAPTQPSPNVAETDDAVAARQAGVVGGAAAISPQAGQSQSAAAQAPSVQPPFAQSPSAQAVQTPSAAVTGAGGAAVAQAPTPAWAERIAARERRAAMPLLAAGIAIGAVSLLLFPPQGNPGLSAWAGWALSLVAALAAMPAMSGGWSKLAMRLSRGVSASLDGRRLRVALALAAIIAFGLALRLYNIDELPAGLYHDELHNIDLANIIRQNPTEIPVYVPRTDLPSFFLLPIAALIELAGTHMTSGRLVAALFGAAGIGAVFLLARSAMGTAMGLAAAFLTAASRWDLNWSRIGMHGITAPFFAALTAYLTFRALRSDRPERFAYAGAVMGLGMWFYAPFRMFPIVIGFILLHAFVFGDGNRRALLRNIAVMALFSLLVAAPLAKFALTIPDEFFHRTREVSLFNFANEGDEFRVLRESFGQHIRMFHFKGDPNGRHNLPGEPMLDPISGVLMALGILFALWRWRQAAFAALPVWVMVMVMPGVLSIPWESPQSLRSIAALPAATTLICAGIYGLWQLAGSRRLLGALPPLAKALPLVAAGLLGVIAYSNLHTYFVRQANDERVYTAFSTDLTKIAEDMTDNLRAGRSVWISRQHELMHHISEGGNRFRRTLYSPANIPLNAGESPNGADIYLEMNEPNHFETLREYYPDGRFREFRPPAGGEAFVYKATLSAGVLADAHGLRMRRYDADGGAAVAADESKFAGDLHLWLKDSGAPVAVELNGLLHISRPGEYALELQGGLDAELVLDGVAVLNGGKRRARIIPAVGLHTLALRARGGGGTDAVRLLWTPPDADAPSVVPAGSLFSGANIRQIGLTARYYDDFGDPVDADGQTPDLVEVMPHVGRGFWLQPPEPLSAPFLAVFDGTLHVPESGEYAFNTDSVNGSMDVYLDGELLVSSRGDRHKTLPLAAGGRALRIERVFNGGPYEMALNWALPNEPLAPIAPRYATPDARWLLRVVE